MLWYGVASTSKPHNRNTFAKMLWCIAQRCLQGVFFGGRGKWSSERPRDEVDICSGFCQLSGLRNQYPRNHCQTSSACSRDARPIRGRIICLLMLARQKDSYQRFDMLSRSDTTSTFTMSTVQPPNQGVVTLWYCFHAESWVRSRASQRCSLGIEDTCRPPSAYCPIFGRVPRGTYYCPKTGPHVHVNGPSRVSEDVM